MNSGIAIVVACCGQKLDHAAPARQLYCSTQFNRLRVFCESVEDRADWYIMSAKYGLLHPDDVVEPYQLVLKKPPRTNGPSPDVPIQDPEVFRQLSEAASERLARYEARVYLMSKAYFKHLPPGVWAFRGMHFLKQVSYASKLSYGEVQLGDILCSH